MKKVLIIDDDPKLCELIKDYLSQFSYEVLFESHPHDGIKVIKGKSIDLVILDVMLPDMDGFTCLKEIRNFSDVPVVMLTARGDTMDKIIGLEVGADDYLSKPFEPRELVARIQVIFRRIEKTKSETSNTKETTLREFGELKINLEKRIVNFTEHVLELTAAEFDLLELLSRQPGKKWSRDEIMEQLHGIESEAMSRSIDIMISRLRYKIQKVGDQREWIKTIRGTGYSFVGVKND